MSMRAVPFYCPYCAEQELRPVGHERAGLVVRGREAQYRPCALDATPLKAISSWAEQYRPIWESRFDRMDEYLTQLRTNERR